PGAQPGRPGRQPQHPYRAAVGGAEPLADLHRGGLAGAVGPEDGGHRTARGRQSETVDRGGAAVPLHEVDDLDGWRCHAHESRDLEGRSAVQPWATPRRAKIGLPDVSLLWE